MESNASKDAKSNQIQVQLRNILLVTVTLDKIKRTH